MCVLPSCPGAVLSAPAMLLLLAALVMLLLVRCLPAQCMKISATADSLRSIQACTWLQVSAPVQDMVFAWSSPAHQPHSAYLEHEVYCGECEA